MSRVRTPEIIVLETIANGWRNRADRLDDARGRLLATLSHDGDRLDARSIDHALDALDPIYAERVFQLAQELSERASDFRDKARGIDAEARAATAAEGGGGR